MWPSNYFLMLFSLSLSSVRRVACQEEPMMRQPDLAPGENFPGTTLQCLVCQAIVDEFDDSIASVDPKKKIEAAAGRMDSSGNTNAKVVKYARSEIHLSELVDSVCEEFENYVQAREKTGERAVTIIRITTKSGGMNPLFGSVDIVPDEDLNKRLKFYCELLVEKYEDDLMELFAKEAKVADVSKDLCSKRTKLCKKKQLWKRDEL